MGSSDIRPQLRSDYPGQPFFLACAMWFSQDTLWLGAVSVALSTLTVLVIYGLARRLLDPTAASIAALLCATCPTFVIAAPLLASEHLSTLLLLLSLLLGCDHPDLRDARLGGGGRSRCRTRLRRAPGSNVSPGLRVALPAAG